MVRCPGCGTAQSPWAAQCEQCGTELAGASSIDAPRRGRRPTPRLAIGTVIVVLAAVLGVTLARDRGPAHHRASPPSAPSGQRQPPAAGSQAPITVVDVDQSGQLVAHDLRTGTARDLAPDAAGWPEGPTIVDNQIIYISAGAVREPGRASPFTSGDSLVPVGGTEQVWATSSPDDGGPTAQLLQVRKDWSPVEDVHLESGETPAAAGPDRLVTVSGSGLLIRDASTGRVLIRTGPVHNLYDVVGVDFTNVVFVPSGCDAGCPMDLVDTSTGATEALPAPPTTTGFIGGGAISSAGDIAAFAAIPGGSGGPSAELVLIDASRVERVVGIALTVSEPVGAAAWDPTGRWLVFGGLRATYLLDRTTMRVSRLSFVAGYGFTVAAG